MLKIYCLDLLACCLSDYLRKRTADIFRAFVLRTSSLLQNRVELFQAVAAQRSSSPGTEREGDRGDADLLEATERLLASVLSAHLVLCRLALFFSWRDPFYTGAPTFLLDEICALVRSLLVAWRLLGVSGEAQKEMVKRLVVVVGRQTLETRQCIPAGHQEQAQRPMPSREVRSAAALRETEGERGAASCIFLGRQAPRGSLQGPR